MWVLLCWAMKSYFIGVFVSFICHKEYENPFSTVSEVATLINKYLLQGNFLFLTIKEEKTSYRLEDFCRLKRWASVVQHTYTRQQNPQWGLASQMCFLHTTHEHSLSYCNDLMILGAKCSSPSCGFKLNLVLSFHSVGSRAILHCAAQARKGCLTQRQAQIRNGYKRSCNCTSSFFPPTGITTNECHWNFFWASAG